MAIAQMIYSLSGMYCLTLTYKMLRNYVKDIEVADLKNNIYLLTNRQE